MRRATVNFIVDAITFLAFVCLTVTGFVIKYAPHGRPGNSPRPAGGDTWLGVPHHAWGEIHFVASIVFIVLILIHIVLHWNWIKGSARSMFVSAPSQPSDDK